MFGKNFPKAWMRCSLKNSRQAAAVAAKKCQKIIRGGRNKVKRGNIIKPKMTDSHEPWFLIPSVKILSILDSLVVQSLGILVSNVYKLQSLTVEKS